MLAFGDRAVVFERGRISEPWRSEVLDIGEGFGHPAPSGEWLAGEQDEPILILAGRVYFARRESGRLTIEARELDGGRVLATRTLEQRHLQRTRGDREGLVLLQKDAIAALDAATLDVRWVKDAAFLFEVGATVVVAYRADGGRGSLVVLDRKDGELVWSLAGRVNSRALCGEVLFELTRYHVEHGFTIEALSVRTGKLLHAIERAVPFSPASLTLIALERRIVLVTGPQDGKSTVFVFED